MRRGGFAGALVRGSMGSGEVGRQQQKVRRCGRWQEEALV